MKIIITGSKGLIGSVLTKMLTEHGHTCYELDLSLGHDLSNEEFVIDFFKNNKADALINLFALNHHVDDQGTKQSLFDISLDSFDDYLKTNLTSLFSVCREFARNNNNGSIVNFSSTYGVVSPHSDMYDGSEKHIGYSVSKAGVIMLSKHLATHLAPKIRVNTIIPGGVLHKQPNEFVIKYSSRTPLKRMMNPEELFGIVKYLISEESNYTTGAEIKIDGGWTAW
jgi:NAD(P)-dependent dehydrogenase (short-subunit alcohol dehydrogenase family)